jgi:hypothetical protein
MENSGRGPDWSINNVRRLLSLLSEIEEPPSGIFLPGRKSFQ